MPKGGKREGAGRKESKDKKEHLNMYVEESKIEALGGKDATKEVMYDAVDKAVKVIKKQKNKQG